MRELRHRASTVVQSARALGRAGGRRQGDAETREDPELALAICYAPRKARAALAALFALDATLADVLRTTTEPMLGQMRLTWWHDALTRSEEHTSELQSLMRISYAVFCLKKKNTKEIDIQIKRETRMTQQQTE